MANLNELIANCNELDTRILKTTLELDELCQQRKATQTEIYRLRASEKAFNMELPFKYEIKEARNWNEYTLVGKAHIITLEEINIGNLRRSPGDSLCPRKSKFWQLVKRDDLDFPTCTGCQRIVGTIQRYYQNLEAKSEMTDVKTCANCGITQPLTNFGTRRKTIDGRAKECKKCEKWARTAKEQAKYNSYKDVTRRFNWPTASVPIEPLQQKKAN